MRFFVPARASSSNRFAAAEKTWPALRRSAIGGRFGLALRPFVVPCAAGSDKLSEPPARGGSRAAMGWVEDRGEAHAAKVRLL